MKYLLVMLPLLVFMNSYSQKPKKEEIITYTTNDGTRYTVGDTIHFGMGTGEHGMFKYVWRVDGWSGNKFWSSSLNNKFAIIDYFKWGGDEKMGKTMFVAFRNAGGLSGMNLESAIEVGEVITPASKKKIAEKNQPVIIQQGGVSAADEILKLKKLLDAGIITQAEFDAKKKKLLE